MPPEKKDEQEAILEELRRAQSQFIAAGGRMTQFVELFREERDIVIKKAVEARIPRATIAVIIDASPQWVNKILRGEAYRRSSD